MPARSAKGSVDVEPIRGADDRELAVAVLQCDRATSCAPRRDFGDLRVRGVEVRLTTSSESPDHRNLVTVRGTLADGQEVSVSGTLAGPKHIQKVVAVGENDVDLVLADHMAFLRYTDRPGVVGTVGRIFGEAGINIAGMQVSRAVAGGEALAVLTVDDTVPSAVLVEVEAEIGATFARSVNLV